MALFDSAGRASGLLLALSDSESTSSDGSSTSDDDEPYVLYEMMLKEMFPDPLCARPKIIGYIEEEISMCSSIFVSATQENGTPALRHCGVEMRALQRRPMETHRAEAEIVPGANLRDVCINNFRSDLTWSIHVFHWPIWLGTIRVLALGFRWPLRISQWDSPLNDNTLQTTDCSAANGLALFGLHFLYAGAAAVPSTPLFKYTLILRSAARPIVLHTRTTVPST